TEAGQIRGWHPSQGNQTVVLADRSGVGAIYKGLAIATTVAGVRFYAADFHNGRVDVFDGNFALLAMPGAFTDPQLEKGYAPFGNFGDGQINAYEELPNGQFAHRGELREASGKSLSIDGLWALQFGHGTANNGPVNTLFFTAGPNDEADGLFGSITAP